MKKVSCGVLITDGMSVLMAKVTLANRWDVPKGEHHSDETFEETAVRELEEETGVRLNTSDITYIDKFYYLPNKDLILYFHYTKELPDTSNMKCSSYFIRKDKEYPEVERFQYVKIKDISKYASATLWSVLQQCLPRITENL